MFRLINFVLLTGIITFSVNVQADYEAPASEVMLLPEFCWGQYNSTLKGPQFKINDCGPGMNHYCPTLIAYNRANRSGSRANRTRGLKTVLKEVEYTLQWMKGFPACPIRDHVEKTYSKVRIDLGLPPVINQTQLDVAPKPAAESDATKGAVSKTENGSGDPGKEGSSSPDEGATQPPREEETKSVESAKIGSPTNPWCRFCPDPVAKP